jgi:hypothetical protein
MLYPPSLGAQPERQVSRIADTYDSLRISINYCDGEELASGADIVHAVLADRPLVARTALANERYSAVLEYPVKTINANERDTIYQTDTGPVLLPDLTREPGDLIKGMELAFVAFNVPGWAEFLVRVPTPVADGISVHHYSRPLRLDTHNMIIGL